MYYSITPGIKTPISLWLGDHDVIGWERVSDIHSHNLEHLERGEINIFIPSMVALCMCFSEICVLARQASTHLSGRVGHVWSNPQSSRVPTEDNSYSTREMRVYPLVAILPKRCLSFGSISAFCPA